MNKHQVIILWIIALVLAGAVTAVKLTQKDTLQSSTQRAPGDTLFESFPGTDITNVQIQGIGQGVNVVKKDGKWVVTERDDYPAKTSTVNDFLRTLGDLKVTQGLEAGPTFAPRFGMNESATTAADRGLTATFKDASGKELAKVSLGKNIENSADESPMGGANAVGRYVRNHADESGFYATKEMFPSLSAEPARWLADDFINPEKIQSIALSELGKDDTAWQISRETETAEFKLDNATPGEILDAVISAPFKSLFSYARFDDVVPAAKIAERANTAGKRTATIKTFEGFTYTITLTPAKTGNTPPPPANPANPQAPANTDKVLITAIVSAELPKTRKKEDGEKPEDAKIKDEAFTSRLKTLTEKLDKEKALAGRTFEIAKSTVDDLLKDRNALITKVGQPPAGLTPNAGVQNLPGGLITPPLGNTAVREPMEAVTPPIAMPPLDENQKATGAEPPN